MCHLWCRFQMLSTHLKQKQVFGLWLKGWFFVFRLSAISSHRTNIQTICTRADQRSPTPATDVTFLLDKLKFKEQKWYRQHQLMFFYVILALSPPCVHHAEVTLGRWLWNLDDAVGGDGLSGKDPHCAHCAERQKDLFQRRTHGNQLWTSLIVA